MSDIFEIGDMVRVAPFFCVRAGNLGIIVPPSDYVHRGSVDVLFLDGKVVTFPTSQLKHDGVIK